LRGLFAVCEPGFDFTCVGFGRGPVDLGLRVLEAEVVLGFPLLGLEPLAGALPFEGGFGAMLLTEERGLLGEVERWKLSLPRTFLRMKMNAEKVSSDLRSRCHLRRDHETLESFLLLDVAGSTHYHKYRSGRCRPEEILEELRHPTDRSLRLHYWSKCLLHQT
jgi:hypothetical protein